MTPVSVQCGETYSKVRREPLNRLQRRHEAAKNRAKSIRSDLAKFRATPSDQLPFHVRHCHETGCREWWIHVVKKNALKGAVTRVPYRCNSWRCPVCRHHEAHVMFARIAKASEVLDPTGWCFFVLTLDRNGTYSGEKRWENAQEAYRDLSRLRGRFFANLRRFQKKMGWAPVRGQWVSTTEAHRAKTGGWPHLNVMVWSPALAEFLRSERAERERQGISGREAIVVTCELLDALERAGFGVMSTAEAARDAAAVAGYITKIAGKADQTTGEITKLTQLPLNMPFRFRRLASGVGFLPPRAKNPDVTGSLVRRQRQGIGGGIDVLPIFRLTKPDLIAISERACALEERIFMAELEAMVRCSKLYKKHGIDAISIPPITHWLGTVRLAQGPPRRGNSNSKNLAELAN